MSYNDEEGTILFPLTYESFEETPICHRFIRNVVTLVAAQLFVVAGFVSAAMLVEEIHEYLVDEKYYYVFLGVLIVSVVAYVIGALLIFRDPELPKRYPANLIVFVTISVALATMAAIVCTTFEFEALVMALGSIFLSFLGIFIFLLNTKFSILTWQGFAFCVVWGLICCSSLIPLPYSTIEMKVLAASISLVFVVILAFEINRIIQLSPQTELSPEDYVVGAFELHSDLIGTTVIFPIFFILLCLVCICTEDRRSENEIGRRYVRHASQRIDSRSGGGDQIVRTRSVRHDRLTAAILGRLSEREPGSV